MKTSDAYWMENLLFYGVCYMKARKHYCSHVYVHISHDFNNIMMHISRDNTDLINNEKWHPVIHISRLILSQEFHFRYTECAHYCDPC